MSTDTNTIAIDDDTMPLTRSAASSSAAANARLAQEKQRTKFLLYVLAFSTAVLVGMQSYRIQTMAPSLATANSRSRYLPESKNTKEEDEAYGPSALYVPSLDFRINGISQYNRDHNFQAHVYCEAFAKDLKWEWWKTGNAYPTTLDYDKKKVSGQTGYRRRLRENQPKQAKSTSKRLMIGVTAGYDNYAKLLEQAVWSARVYGQTWGRKVTVVTLQGTSFAPHGCKAPASHTTLNKIRLLFHAIDHSDDYDQVLLLDADAFVYDMNVDLTALLDTKKHLIAAQPLPGAHTEEIWNIHTGATLWNLEHEYIASVALDWFERAKAAVVRGTYTNDQEYLQETLKDHLDYQREHDKRHGGDIDMVMNFKHEFEFSEGTVVKQFVHEVSSDDLAEDDVYANPNIPERLEQMLDAATEVCAKHAQACAGVTPPQYDAA